MRPFEADLVATGYESAPGHDIAWVINGNDIVPGPTLQRTFLGQPDVDETVELNLSVTSPYGCQADSTVLAVVRQTPVAKLEVSAQPRVQERKFSSWIRACTPTWSRWIGVKAL